MAVRGCGRIESLRVGAGCGKALGTQFLRVHQEALNTPVLVGELFHDGWASFLVAQCDGQCEVEKFGPLRTSRASVPPAGWDAGHSHLHVDFLNKTSPPLRRGAKWTVSLEEWLCILAPLLAGNVSLGSFSLLTCKM